MMMNPKCLGGREEREEEDWRAGEKQTNDKSHFGVKRKGGREEEGRAAAGEWAGTKLCRELEGRGRRKDAQLCNLRNIPHPRLFYVVVVVPFISFY
jgi:hypothetical protein